MAERPSSDAWDYVALVRSLLDELAPTSITRLDVRHGDLRVALRRTPGIGAPGVTHHAAPAPEEPGRPAHWHAVEAPLTGIFYTRPSPDDEPYVQIGSHIDSDHIVGLIETMKMFNEVTADVTGAVREIMIENGALVESGQALLYVEPGESLQAPTMAGG